MKHKYKHCMDEKIKETNILENMLVCVPKKRENHTGLMRVSKLNNDRIFI